MYCYRKSRHLFLNKIHVISWCWGEIWQKYEMLVFLSAFERFQVNVLRVQTVPSTPWRCALSGRCHRLSRTMTLPRVSPLFLCGCCGISRGPAHSFCIVPQTQWRGHLRWPTDLCWVKWSITDSLNALPRAQFTLFLVLFCPSLHPLIPCSGCWGLTAEYAAHGNLQQSCVGYCPYGKLWAYVLNIDTNNTTQTSREGFVVIVTYLDVV